jgi:hypothetical protein
MSTLTIYRWTILEAWGIAEIHYDRTAKEIAEIAAIWTDFAVKNTARIRMEVSA